VSAATGRPVTTAADVAELESKRDALLKGIANLKATLVQAEARRARLAELAGRDAEGKTLPLGPLVAALVGVVLANACVFAGFIVWLTRWNEMAWPVFYFLASFISIATFPRSKASRSGAGGLARRGLRRVAMVFLVIGALMALAGLVGPELHRW
jgi:hypothetical protein